MPRRITRFVLAIASLLVVAACASPYYEITDPTTGKVYYTGSDIAARYPESGAVRFQDARTGRIVTLASHEIRPLTKAQFNAAVKETAVPVEGAAPAGRTSGNPLFDGWYADPEGAVLDGRYWIFPTLSAPYDEQTRFDAFSSPDLVTWTKHERVLDTSVISWARRAMWAPAIIEKDGRYYLFFSANDLQRPGGPYWHEDDARNHTGGIGVAVADLPEGPYRDYLGKPLIAEFHNDAQPIDQFVFRDADGTHYLVYGGWGRCNMAVLNDDFTGFVPWEDGTLFREITPEGYVEGPVMFRRNGTYYFMWSEGSWGDGSYKVAYATADRAAGPFVRIGTILESDPRIATGAGHNSVINTPGTDDWYIVYHRRPIPNEGRDHRVTCIDRLEFNDDGTIRPVRMTFEGVAPNPLPRGR